MVLSFAAVGVPMIYNSNDIDKLNALEQAVDAISANGGGDCPELGMAGILNAWLTLTQM